MPETLETPTKPINPFRDAMAKAAQVDIAKATGEAPKTPEPEKQPEKTPEPAKAPEKPAAKSPEQEQDWAEKVAPAKGSPNSLHWDKLKGERDQALGKLKETEPKLTKLSEYEKELAELRKHPKVNAEEISKLKADYDSLKAQHEAVALEIMPEFEQKYAAKLDRVGKSLKESLPADVLDKVNTLLALPESEYKRKQLSELSENLDQFQVAEIAQASREIRGILGERKSELDNAKAKLNEIVTNRTKAQQEREQAAAKLFDEVLADAVEKNPMLKRKEGDAKEVAEWNKDVEDSVEIAKQAYFGRLDPKDSAELFLRGTRAHIAAKELSSAYTRIKELEEVVAKMQGSGPELNGGGHDDKRGSGKNFSQMLGDRIAKGK